MMGVEASSRPCLPDHNASGSMNEVGRGGMTRF